MAIKQLEGVKVQDEAETNSSQSSNEEGGGGQSADQAMRLKAERLSEIIEQLTHYKFVLQNLHAARQDLQSATTANEAL